MNLPPLPINPWVLALLVISGGLLLFSVIRAGSSVVTRSLHWTILSLRIAGFILLILALINPFLPKREPDPDAYRVAILVDVSASMEAIDLPNDMSRLEWVAGWLDPDRPTSSFTSLTDPQTPVEVSLFSSETRPWDGSDINQPWPGQTAIGDALESIRSSGTDRSRRPLGAVLLLSDGANLEGLSPIQAAEAFRQADIPVSVLGIGRQQVSGDVTVEFDQPRLTLTEGEAASVQVNIQNSFPSFESGQLDIFRNDTLLDSRVIELDADVEQAVTIEVEPGEAGVDTFRAVYSPKQQRGNPATNVSYSIARVDRKGTYRFLLLSAGAGWEARFLRLLAMESATIRMDSLIRIDEGRFIRIERAGENVENQAAERQTLNSLPADFRDYLFYDAIILDVPMVTEESETLEPILKEFAGTKGGGLLLLQSSHLAFGKVSLPGSVRELFPVRDFSVNWTERPVPLELSVNPLFSDQSGGVLFSGPPPSIPGESALAVPSGLSRATRSHVTSLEEDLPIFVTQAYGAGRVAWLGTDYLWRWQLADERSSERFKAFWEATLSWLSVGGKDRLVSPLNATIVPSEGDTALEVRLLGTDFTPRMDAIVTALLTGPDGEISEHRLVPDIENPGRYNLPLSLGVPGPYQVDYEALFPDGDRLVETSWFAVSANNPESRDTAFREKPLRDIARITRGEYRSFSQWDDLAPLPISRSIPLVERKSHWTRTLPFLLAALAVFLIEWWIRRRHGLR